MNSQIPIYRPSLGKEEADSARRAIMSGWVTQGPEVAAFEAEFAGQVGANHACAVANCTVALHLALRVAGVGPGDEVITVSHSFIATAASIRYCGAVPVFVDIDSATFNIDVGQIDAAISPRTRAILCVHQMGMPCDLRALIALAHDRGLPVIEDAACAIGSEILWNGQWEPIGLPHSDVACFSFHPRKLLTTGDGGMLTTRHADWDRQFRLSRQHGMSVPDMARHSAQEVIFESYEMLGYNYRLTDIQAAVGREQLKRVPALVAKRREQVQRYRELLGGVSQLLLPGEPEWARSNWQSFCVRLAEGLPQREVMQHLLDKGISTRRGIMCAHREPAFRTEIWRCICGSRLAGKCDCLHESERAQDHGIILPLFDDLEAQEQVAIVRALVDAVRALA